MRRVLVVVAVLAGCSSAATPDPPEPVPPVERDYGTVCVDPYWRPVPGVVPPEPVCEPAGPVTGT